MDYEEFLEIASEELIDEFIRDENKHNDSLTTEQYFYQNCRYYEEKLNSQVAKRH